MGRPRRRACRVNGDSFWADVSPQVDEADRAALEDESEAVMERWRDRLGDHDWRLFHDLPATFYDVLNEYEKRGVTIAPRDILPDYAISVYTLRRFGRADALRRDVADLERMMPAAAALVEYSDALALDRAWQRLQRLLSDAEYAERELAERGFSIDEHGRLRFFDGKRGRPGHGGREAIRHVYKQLRPIYLEAWAEKRDTRELRGHIGDLLSPFLGPLPDETIREAIRELWR